MQKLLLIGLGNPGKKYQATRHNAGRMFVKWLSQTQPQKENPFVAVESESFMNESGKFVKKILSNFNVILSEESSMSEGSSVSDINIGGNRLDCHGAATAPRNDKHSNLLIAHDDLDLPLGQFKIQFGRGPRDHKGLLSIYQSLGTKKFWHVRIGIDNRGGPVIAKAAFGGLWQSRPQTDSHAPPSGARNDSQYRESGETYTLKPFRKEEREILEKVFIKIKLKITERNTGFNL